MHAQYSRQDIINNWISSRIELFEPHYAETLLALSYFSCTQTRHTACISEYFVEPRKYFVEPRKTGI